MPHRPFSATARARLLLCVAAVISPWTLLTGCDTRSPSAPATAGAGGTAASVATETDPRSKPEASETPAGGTTRPVAQPVRWPQRAPTGTFVDRADPLAVRFVSYNVMWNAIFPEVDAAHAPKFARVVQALDPDILALQEIGRHPGERDNREARFWTAEDVQKLMHQIAPPPPGGQWYTYQGHSNVIVSKYPLLMTASRLEPRGDRDLAMALIDLPDDVYPVDFYVLNNHYKCCGGTDNDPQRQQQSDAIAAWIRAARAPGGPIDLPRLTAIVIAGDLNIVGGFQPVTTLLEGDIQDEARYGPDFKPDWDDTPLTDLRPLHNITGPDDWTWRNDNDQWDPGRLDYIIYTDSVLEAAKSFMLNTTTMTSEDLAAAGLQKFDVTLDEVGREFDHLPLVVDFRVLGLGE